MLPKRVNPILVLSYLPYSPCGATAAILAWDILQQDSVEARRLIEASIKTLLDAGYPISVRSVSATGHGPGSTKHYWLSFSKCRGLQEPTENLIKEYIDDPAQTFLELEEQGVEI